MAGRQTKLTPEVQEKIVKAILDGNYFETACRYAGIGEATAYEWLARGEGKDPKGRRSTKEFAEFAEAVRTAEAEMEIKTVSIVQKELAGDGKLTLEFLARRFPQRWGNRDQMTILRKAASELDKMNDDELLAFIAQGRRTRQNLEDGNSTS